MIAQEAAAPRPLTALSEDERLFQQTVRKFAREEIRPHVRAMDEECIFRKEIIRSFFELGLMAMPLVRGNPDDRPERPRGRIRRTRLLFTVAALTMSAYLLASTLLTTLLIPAGALTTNGQAKYRALAYLAGSLTDGNGTGA